jgi:hemerythrin-like domain-containing protein
MELHASEHYDRLWARPVVSPVIQQLRLEHEWIARGLADLRLVADALPDLPQVERGELIRVAVALFRRFEQHTLEEERDIYTHVSRLLGDRRLTAAMIYDHRALKAAATELAGIDPLDSPRIQALLYGLHTLLTAHMQKEEEIIFPILEPPSIDSAGRQQRFDEFPRPWAVQSTAARPLQDTLSHR